MSQAGQLVIRSSGLATGTEARAVSQPGACGPAWSSTQAHYYHSGGRAVVHFNDSKGKDKGSTMAERMTDYLLAMRRQRQASIEAKLKAGYRPRLDDQGNVILVKVEDSQRRQTE